MSSLEQWNNVAASRQTHVAVQEQEVLPVTPPIQIIPSGFDGASEPAFVSFSNLGVNGTIGKAGRQPQSHHDGQIFEDIPIEHQETVKIDKETRKYVTCNSEQPRDQVQTLVRTEDTDMEVLVKCAKQRKPFGEDERQQTSHTRDVGACVRCKMQRVRVRLTLNTYYQY